MEKIKEFCDLDAWKKAKELAIAIYKTTKTFPKEEIYGIINQIRRASLSITSNIAEGFGRFHFNDKIRFYYNARGSINEVKNILLISNELGFIDTHCLKELLSLSETTLRMLNGLIRSIEKQK